MALVDFESPANAWDLWMSTLAWRTCCHSLEGTDHYVPCPVGGAQKAALEGLVQQRVRRIARVAGHRRRLGSSHA